MVSPPCPSKQNGVYSNLGRTFRRLAPSGCSQHGRQQTRALIGEVGEWLDAVVQRIPLLLVLWAYNSHKEARKKASQQINSRAALKHALFVELPSRSTNSFVDFPESFTCPDGWDLPWPPATHPPLLCSWPEPPRSGRIFRACPPQPGPIEPAKGGSSFCRFQKNNNTMCVCPF